MKDNYRFEKPDILPTYGQFAQCISTKFNIKLEQKQNIELVLSGISDKKKSEKSEEFSLYFIGAANVLLPQSTYKLEHFVLGPVDLYLVPIGREKWGNIYEAVFNKYLNLNE